MHHTSFLNVFGIVAFFAIGACGPEPLAAPLEAHSASTGVHQGIMRGRPTGPEAFGAVGALVSTDKYGNTLSICTGCLIAPDVVLTAAHCIGVKNKPAAGRQMWFSTAATAAVFAQSAPVRVAHSSLHPNYDPEAELQVPLAWRGPRGPTELSTIAELEAACGAAANAASQQQFWQCVLGLSPDLQRRLGLVDGSINMSDVGLAILAKPLLSAPLAQLPTQVTAPVWPLQAMQAVGYGIFDDAPQNDGRMVRQVGELSLDGVGVYELQVGFGQSQLSFGDSGGPLFAAGDAAQEIIGIASRSLTYADGHCQGPTLFARTQAFVPWIRASLREACRAQQRSLEMCQAYPF